jgi:hypothetical protein
MTPHPAPRPAPGNGGEYVAVERDTLDAVTELIASGHDHDEKLRAAAYDQGRQARLAGGYQEGFTLGHDTGLSARQDTRGYVHGIIDGFHAGCEQRHQLTADLLHHTHTGPVARQAAREAGREAETS